MALQTGATASLPRRMRPARPVNLLSYNTLIHLDRIIDFRVPADIARG